MKITAQEEYGLRCLIQLARHPSGGMTTVKEIAKLEGISLAYAEKLLRALSLAGLVKSLRGIKGGYRLTKLPGEITLGQVVRALGSVLSPKAICARYTGQRVECIHFSNCGIRSAWAGLTRYIEEFLDQTTLAQLLPEEKLVDQALAERRRMIPHE
ncbi:MAG: Rrf2 family transcriptional regulator [Candidatus Omnitrophica bacterium]|nr:Rrf2 family transcriptional regulator [Candidatus Omnitrophota bacterium]